MSAIQLCTEFMFYVFTFTGVRYKGRCKNVGTTWTEGCFTYKVQVVEDRSIYRLIEGGKFDYICILSITHIFISLDIIRIK